MKRAIIPVLVALTLLVVAFIYRDPLQRWFGLREPAPEVSAVEPLATEVASDAAAPGFAPLPAITFDEPVLESLRTTYAAYDRARDLLAADRIEGVSEPAQAMVTSLEHAHHQLTDAPEETRDALVRTRVAALSLASASDIEAARRQFQTISEGLVALGAADPRLTEGWHIFSCPMTEGFGKWLQSTPQLENPYMGQRMLQCGSASDWTTVAKAPVHEAHDPDDIAHYTCPMHPSVKQEGPGQCPICGMDLTPVTTQELQSGTILVDEARRQRIGVRTEKVQTRALTLPIRAPGEVTFDEGRLHEVNLRVTGWVEKLEVDETGQKVSKGQQLFTLYSPELYAAQLEHLSAVRRQGSNSAGTFVGLHRASYNRLLLLGMSKTQIVQLEKRDEPWEHLPITSPASGYVIEKNIIEGASVEAGTAVYKIADLSKVWIDASVYESDMPHVRKGQNVRVEFPFVPGKDYTGTVDYIYPTLNEQTRTGRVRIALENEALTLKPSMYADVTFTAELGEHLVVPESAVIYTGPRRIVFVDLGEGRLRPQTVELGVHADGYYAVKSGLTAGDVVVTSGNFLIAAESRIRSASQAWETGDPAVAPITAGGGAHASH